MLPATHASIMDYDGLVASPDVDLVYISLPNHLHEEWACRALQHGKHVICEKPLGLSEAAVERMLGVAARAGCLLFENLMYLHHPQHAAVREAIAGGAIGRVRTLRCVFGFPFPRPGDFRLDPAQGGGAFHDLARYPLGTALHFLRGDTYRFHGVSLHHEGLSTAMHGCALTSAQESLYFSMAFGQQYESFYEIVGEHGRIRVDRAFTTPADLANRVSVTCGTHDRSFTVPPADHFLLMLEHVCELILAGGSYAAAHARARTIARLAGQMQQECEHVDY